MNVPICHGRGYHMATGVASGLAEVVWSGVCGDCGAPLASDGGGRPETEITEGNMSIGDLSDAAEIERLVGRIDAALALLAEYETDWLDIEPPYDRACVEQLQVNALTLISELRMALDGR